MQEDKFLRAELCIHENTEKDHISTAVTVSSPKDVCCGSARYWKHKYESAMEAYQTISDKSISLEEIPNLLPVTKVTPKLKKENVRVTQVHSSMEGKKTLEMVSLIKEDKAKKEKANKERKSKLNNKLRHSINVRKSVHVEKMFAQQINFENPHVAIMF